MTLKVIDNQYGQLF